MNKIVITLMLLAMTALLGGCDDGDGGVTVDPILENCADFSGTYDGTYNETSCDGNKNSGVITGFVVEDGCDLAAEWLGIGLATGAKIYDVTDTSFKVIIPIDEGCGSITGSCTYSTSTVNCTYSYAQGGEGTMDLTKR